ncbi:MAG TPA: 4-(cytidine 5'-diphospho)-2-C-methyl-D-erythritol kinase [Candidatus Sulfotelmatobacter sp.]
MRSFAKINLGLRIGQTRADGFHELLTVYQTIAWHDIIKVSVERGRGIEIRCADPRVPSGESNTCYRMAELAMNALRAKAKVVIEIKKRLPVQAGLGGASANAVSVLLGIERALKKTLPAARRLCIASEVGSDVPLFLVGGTVLGVGRGEQVYPVEDLPAIACVVVTPEIGVSTPKAFAEWDRLCRAGKLAGQAVTVGDSARAAAITKRLRPAWTNECSPPHTSGSLINRPKLTLVKPSDRMIELGRAYSAWLSLPYSGAPLVDSKRSRAENPLLALVRAGIMNDFEQVVFPEYPELCKAKRALERSGARYASLSGSGSSLYGLFDSRQDAALASAKLRSQGWAAQATETVTRRQYWKRLFV